MKNPFLVNKASLLSDREVYNRWVELNLPVNPLEKLKSAMPAFVIGGKGCGKTHLLRYYSYQVLSEKYSKRVLEEIRRIKFLGVYARVENLNNDRFSGKGKSEDFWVSVFESYFEIWMLRGLLVILKDILEKSPNQEDERKVIQIIKEEFVEEDQISAQTISEMIALTGSLRKRLDKSVSMAFDASTQFDLGPSRAKILGKVADFLYNESHILRGVQINYIIDEFELLNESQQKYINTLVRQVGPSWSFKIGVRAYGLKTYDTLFDGETNRPDSEFQTIVLDEELRHNPKHYLDFARSVLKKRIEGTGFDTSFPPQVDKWFEPRPYERGDDAGVELVGTSADKMPRYLEKLAAKLARSPRVSKKSANDLASKLRVPGLPLVEKSLILMFVRAMRPNTDLDSLIERLGKLATYARENPESPIHPDVAKILSYFKEDLLAQIYRDYDKDPSYCGFATIVRLSGGLMRNLLMILRHLWDYAEFQTQGPWNGGVFSCEAQNAAIEKASMWFFTDAKVKGPRGMVAQECVARLCDFLKELRYAEKLTEPSLCTVAIPGSGISAQAISNISSCEKYSLLLPASGHKTKTGVQVLSRYQVNPILSPRWGLPISRRGTMELTPDEVNSIFGETGENFQAILKERLLSRSPIDLSENGGGQRDLFTDESL